MTYILYMYSKYARILLQQCLEMFVNMYCVLSVCVACLSTCVFCSLCLFSITSQVVAHLEAVKAKAVNCGVTGMYCVH